MTGPAGATEARDAPAWAMLDIVGGFHAGQRLPLATDEMTLGAALAADVVLFDPVLEPVHLRLRRAGRAELDVTALAAGVRVRGRAKGAEPLVPDETVTLPLPVEIEIGGTDTGGNAEGSEYEALGGEAPVGGLRLRVQGPEIRPRPPGRALVPYAAGAMVRGPAPRERPHPIALALPLVALLALFPLSRALMEDDAPRPIASRPGPAPADGAGAARDALAGTALARAALEDRLARLGLTEVSLTVDGATIVAGGAVPADRVADWSNVQLWFDNAHGRNVDLVSDVASVSGSAERAPRIEAAWFGASPYVMSRGQRYLVGQTLPDGWTIEAILPDHVRVSNAGRSLKVAY